MKILAFTNDTGSPWWRLRGQAHYLNENGHQMYVTSHKNWNNDTLGADIVIIEMMSNPTMVDVCHKQGAKVIFEVDDLIEGSSNRRELKRDDEIVKTFYNTVKQCDAITTTNEVLAKKMRKYGKTYVLPNYLDTNWWKEVKRPKRYDKTVRIGWAGGSTHYEDLKMVEPALEYVLNKYDTKFIYAGFGGMVGGSLQSIALWGEDLFPRIPKNKREYYKGVDTPWWPDKSQQLDLDIAIAPLIDDEFNHCKTHCKWIEYSINKVAGVYSPTVYDRVVNGKNGLIARNIDEWIKHLSFLIENKKERDKIAQNAYNDVQKHLLKDHWKEWLDVYKEVWNQ